MASTSAAEEPPLENNKPAPFSSLPDDVVLNCLARVSRWDHFNLSLVSKTFRSIIGSRELHATRSHLGRTERSLYVCLRVLFEPNLHWFTLRPSNPNLLVPIPSSPFELPRHSSIVALGTDIYAIGGCTKGKETSSVFLLDCRSHTWRRLPSMRWPRWCPAAGAVDGKIYVIGGRDEASVGLDLDLGEFFDPKTQNWEPIWRPGHELQVSSRLSWFTQGAVLDGKLCSLFGPKCFTYEPKGGRFEAADESMMSGLVESRCVAIENVLYTCGEDAVLRWYDAGERIWRDVKGVELQSLSLNSGKLVNYGGNLAVFWRASMDGQWRPEISYTEIALERRSRGEIWGKVKCSNVVLTLDYPCRHINIVDSFVITL